MGRRYLYAALGDSITGGFVASLCHGFAYRFNDYLEFKNCNTTFCNLGCPKITSFGLLKQLSKDHEVGCIVRRADIITITIGANNILKSTCDGYRIINKLIANRWIKRFKNDWPRILHCIREKHCSNAQIYVMTLYNPYGCSDPNYDKADYYINEINSIIADSDLVTDYDYSVVDIYPTFESNKHKSWTFFNNCILRDPHPNWRGQKAMFCMLKKAYEEYN